ncbi:MAG: helix-turn-helix domain-containing protein [Actinomycetota bacterium]|jgi:AcrR family transcriptional regulator
MASPVKRAYDTRRREAQARRTQRHIAETARELFIERGYVATSIRDIADRAGVSVQTIYNAFEGGKAAIFRRVMDILVVGDDEPLALTERPEYQAMFETRDAKELLSIAVGLLVALYQRMEPLIPTIRAAVASDSSLAEDWRANYGRNRYEGIAAGTARLAELGALRTGVDAARAADVIWAILSLENYEALVVERSWTPDEYAVWAHGALRATLLKGR